MNPRQINGLGGLWSALRRWYGYCFSPNIPQRITPSPVLPKHQWAYHVAIVFHTGNTETIIDPSLSAKPVSINDWLALIGTDVDHVKFQFHGWTTKNRMASLANAQPIDEEGILETASTMFGDVQAEGSWWTAADKAESARELAKLNARYPELTKILINKGLVTQAPADEPDSTVTAEHISQYFEEHLP